MQEETKDEPPAETNPASTNSPANAEPPQAEEVKQPEPVTFNKEEVEQAVATFKEKLSTLESPAQREVQNVVSGLMGSVINTRVAIINIHNKLLSPVQTHKVDAEFQQMMISLGYKSKSKSMLNIEHTDSTIEAMKHAKLLINQ